MIAEKYNSKDSLKVILEYYAPGVFHANQISMCLDPHLN